MTMTELKKVPEQSGDRIDHVISTEAGELATVGNREVAHQYNMRLLREAIDGIGMGRYQWQLFFTCGFGFVVDQMLLVAVGLVLPQIAKEFVVKNADYIVIALYVGLLVGALLCGATVDIFGRRFIWLASLFLVSIWTMICAAAPNFTVLCVFTALQAVCGGGNLAIDLIVFTEFLPQKNRYLLTTLACMWGIGNAIGGLIAWPLIANFSCPPDATPATCVGSTNRGWRYQYIVIGGLCLILAIVRVLVSQLHESPGWLLGQHQFEKASAAVTEVAKLNGREAPPNLEWARTGINKNEAQLPAHKYSVLRHLKGLFVNAKQARSTLLVLFLWMGIGIAYPIYSLFLPQYLAAHGAKTGDGSTTNVYRDYTISSIVGIFGPILSGFLVRIPKLGRRRSMTITACCAGSFAVAFTTVRTEAQNLAFSSMINFWQNAFYGILYAYTPEVMPISHRGTGCGISLAAGRLASISSPIIATYANTKTSAPIWVCCALYFAMALVALVLPFEPGHYRTDDVNEELKV